MVTDVMANEIIQEVVLLCNFDHRDTLERLTVRNY